MDGIRVSRPELGGLLLTGVWGGWAFAAAASVFAATAQVFEVIQSDGLLG